MRLGISEWLRVGASFSRHIGRLLRISALAARMRDALRPNELAGPRSRPTTRLILCISRCREMPGLRRPIPSLPNGQGGYLLRVSEVPYRTSEIPYLKG